MVDSRATFTARGREEEQSVYNKAFTRPEMSYAHDSIERIIAFHLGKIKIIARAMASVEDNAGVGVVEGDGPVRERFGAKQSIVIVLHG